MIPRSSATAAAIPSVRVRGTPTRTKYAVLRADRRKVSSVSALVKFSSPTTSTEKGVRRSLALVSVKLMKSDWSTGQTVKTRNSSRNGSARIHAARPSRRREPTRLREGSAGRSGPA